MDKNKHIKNDIEEYKIALQHKYWGHNDDISKLQRSSEVLSSIDFWVQEVLIEDIEHNGIDDEEGFESYFNQEHCHISSTFMEYYTEKYTLLIKDVDEIMSFVRNELPEHIYESDYYEEIRECFYKQFDIVIYTIAKKLWDYLSDDIIKFKKIINE